MNKPVSVCSVAADDWSWPTAADCERDCDDDEEEDDDIDAVIESCDRVYIPDDSVAACN